MFSDLEPGELVMGGLGLLMAAALIAAIVMAIVLIVLNIRRK